MRLRATPTDGEVFVRAKRLAAILNVSCATLWRWSKEGRIPRPYKLGPATSAWRLAEVYRALDRRPR